MAVETEISTVNEQKAVNDLTAALTRLQNEAIKVNRSNLSDLERQIDALSSNASGSIKRMLTGLKGSVQELDGMLQGSGRNIAAAWKTVAADTLARVNADMSKVKLAYQTRFEEAGRAAVAAATKMAADIQAAERKAFSAVEPTGGVGQGLAAQARARAEGYTNAFGTFISASSAKMAADIQAAERKAFSAVEPTGGVGQGLAAQARARAEGYTNAFGTFISASSAKMAADIQAAERRMLSAGSSGVASAATARTRTAGSTNALGLFTPAQPQLDVKAYIPTTAVPQVNALSQAFRKLTVDGNDVHSAMRGLASGFNLLWLTWGNLAPLFAGASISFGVTKTFEIGSEVEHNINMLQVLGDKTKEQGSVIREELRKIDQTTLFSLKELSKTMVDLEQAGISGADALKLVKTSADLAAVGNTNLDVTSKLLTQTMGVFPETAADITKAAAQMFKATKDGKLDINNIGESMRYASTANLMYGQSLEDTLVALQALASVGIKDTQAGTGFANMLQDLTGRTKPAKKAIAELETALGRTIKAFDAEGKARPFLDVVSDIQEALEKFKPEKALDLANKVFSERGLRPLFASIARGTTDLSEYKKVLESIDPSSLGKAAAKAMDTTKGAMDQLKGSLVGVLDRTFESMDSRFKDSLKRMTAMIDSEEFSRMLRGLVSGVVAIGEAAITYMPAITKLGAAFVAFKALALVQPMLLGAASALAGLIGLLNLGSVQMGRMAGSAVAGATSMGALGASMIVTAASSRAAAAGLGVVQVEAAGAAAKLTVAAGAGRAAAVVLGFLANPIVGVITTLGLLAYTFSSVSKSSQTASEELTSKIYKDGKVNIDILNQEIAKINERNVVAASRRGKATVFDAPADEALAKYRESNKKLDDARSRADAVTDERQKETRLKLVTRAEEEQKIAYDNWHALHFARQKVLDQSEKLETEAETKRQKGVQAAIERDKKNRERELSGLEGSPDVTGKFARSHTTAIKHIKDNLESIASSSQAAIAQLTDTYNTERDILKNAHGNQLIDEGTYQAKSLAQLQAYEAKKLALLDEKDEASRMEVVRVYEENTKVLSKQLAQAKGTADEQLAYRVEKEKEFSEEMNRVGEKVRSDLANSQTERVKLTNEAVKRMTVAYQDYEGVVKKLDLKTDEEILAIRLRREEAEATENLARQYDGVTTSSMAFLQAQKASALASAAAQAEAQKHLETVDKAIALAEKASESFSKFITEKNIPWTDEVINALRGMDMEIEALRRNRTKYLGEATTDIAAAGKRAFASVIAEDLQRLKTGTSDAIMTGLFEGGKAGRSSLRKLIVDELKRPIRLVVDAFVNTVFGSVLGGAGSAVGSVGGSVVSSMAGNYVSGALGAGVFGSSAAYGAALGTTSIGAGSQAAMLAAQTGEFGLVGLTSTAQAAGTASAFSAALPWVGAALAVVSLLSSLDDSGTYHTGGLAGYSAAGGTLKGDAVKAAGLDFNLASKDYTTSGETASTAIAKSVVGMLDSTATAFGKQAGYYAATAFADDTSASGAWGALMVQLGDSLLLDWKSGTDKWPGREFADGEAGAKEYASAIAVDIRDLLVKQTPEWAQTIFKELGDTPTLETLGTAVAQVNNLAAVFKTLGAASSDFAAVAGTALNSLVTALGGAEPALATLSSYYANFYSESERLKLSTDAVTSELAKLGKTLPKTRDEFRALVDAALAAGNTELVSSLLKVSSSFSEITTSAEDLATSAVDNISPAFDVLSTAIDKQKAIIQVSVDSAKALVDEVKGIFDLLSTSITELRNEVLSPSVNAAGGNAFINSAIASAASGFGLPAQDELSAAISAARGGLGLENFSSLADQTFAKAELAGRLETLKGFAGSQLSAAEQLLDVAESQLKDLDDTLEYWKQQVELAQGNIDTTATVEVAIRDLIEVIKDPTGAKKADTAVKAIMPTTNNSLDAYRSSIDDLPSYAQKDWINVGGKYVNVGGYTMANAEDYYAARLQQAYWSPEADMASTWNQLLQSNFAGSTDVLLAMVRGAGLDKNIISSYENEFLPKLAVGTNYVPRDGAYYLHQGEAVQPVAYNPAVGGSAESARVAAQTAEELAAIKELLASMARSSFRSAEALNGNPESPMLVQNA